jgi:hypothetical protein
LQLEKFDIACKMFLKRGRWLEIAKYVGNGATGEACANKWSKQHSRSKITVQNLKTGEWTQKEVFSSCFIKKYLILIIVFICL